MTAVVFAPHADDAEMGCGGLIARLTELCQHVTIVVASCSSYTALHSKSVVDGTERVLEAGRAASLLNAKLEVWQFPENQLHAVDREKLVSNIESTLDACRPDLVLIPLSSFNQDHEALWKACITALRPSRTGHLPGRVWAYEMPLNSWGDTGKDTGFTGKKYVPLDVCHLHRKNEALLCHKSQVVGRERSLISTTAITALARMRGLECSASLR